MHRDAALIAFGHQHKSRRHEIIRPQRNHVKMRELAHRRFDRLASQHHRLGQVHAGDDADPLAVTNEQGVAVDLAHHVARGFDGIARINECRGVQEQLGDPRAHQRAVAPLLLVAGELIQFARDLAVEERGKPRIALDQPECHALGSDVAQTSPREPRRRGRFCRGRGRGCRSCPWGRAAPADRCRRAPRSVPLMTTNRALAGESCAMIVSPGRK